MSKISVYIISFFLLFSSLLGNDISIKSLRTYSSEYEGAFPVVILSNENSSELIIEFDVEAEYIPDFIIEFKFCDKNWIPEESYFFENPGYNIAYNLYFESLSAAIKGADYHFSAAFPNYDVSFPFSGKWIFNIKVAGNPEYVYGSGKFYVVRPEVILKGRVTKERLEDVFLDPGIADRSHRVEINFELPYELFPQDVSVVEIIENHKIDFPYLVTRKEYDDLRYYEWNGDRRFTFVARDIIPSNEYRNTDIRDARRYFSPVVNAQPDATENSRLFFYGGKDINGRSVLSNYRDNESEYLYVNFTIRPSEIIDNDVFITGAFNNWRVLPEYKMNYNKGIYELSIELKRGKYDYQYVTGDIVDNIVTNINWSRLEGNFWETENNYFVFLFYRTTEFGGYDKIIGYVKL